MSHINNSAFTLFADVETFEKILSFVSSVLKSSVSIAVLKWKKNTELIFLIMDALWLAFFDFYGFCLFLNFPLYFNKPYQCLGLCCCAEKANNNDNKLFCSRQVSCSSIQIINYFHSIIGAVSLL